VGTGFPKRSCLNKKIERDDHPARVLRKQVSACSGWAIALR
jgi:hypothetical protein